jgi:hypothetical protein
MRDSQSIKKIEQKINSGRQALSKFRSGINKKYKGLYFRKWTPL